MAGASKTSACPAGRCTIMHFKSKNLAASLLVGIALLGGIHPASADFTSTTLNTANAVRPTYNTSTPEKAPADTIAKLSSLKVQAATPLDIWLERLAETESQGRDRIKILDVNDKYSYGCLQFQEGTFRKYGERYGLVSPNTRLEDVIYNCNLQKEIAKKMIGENYAMWQSWYTSVIVRDVGLPPRS